MNRFLYLPILLAAACSRSEQVNTVVSQKPSPVSAESAQALNAPDTADQKKESDKKITAYWHPILDYLLGEKADPSISFHSPGSDPNLTLDVSLVPDVAAKKYLMEDLLAIGFHDIPGKPPYRAESKRLLQTDPTKYVRDLSWEPSLNRIKCDGIKAPIGLLAVRKGYLYGECAFWRISSRDGKVLKEAVCCPNPLIIKNASGERLLELALISPSNSTIYAAAFPPRKEPIECMLTTGTKKEYFNLPSGNFKILTLIPECEGETGGTCRIDFDYLGQSYHMEFPWGDAVFSHLKR